MIAAIIGASGAIGSTFINKLQNNSNVEKIYSFSRRNTDHITNKIIHNIVDITDEESIKNAVKIIDQNALPDLVIVTTGLLHDNEVYPEKSMKDISYKNFLKLIEVNTIGPALLLKHFVPLMNHKKNCKFIILSARLGSISDNHLGGWYSYRASKAALNMVIKCASIEAVRKYKNLIIIGMHPGTVESNLTEPFQKNIKPEKLFNAGFSVEKMMNVINNLESCSNGQCIDYNGKILMP